MFQKAKTIQQRKLACDRTQHAKHSLQGSCKKLDRETSRKFLLVLEKPNVKWKQMTAFELQYSQAAVDFDMQKSILYGIWDLIQKREKEDSSSNFILWKTPRTLQHHTPLTDRTH